MTSSWMLVAGLLFATMAVFVKIGTADFDAAELAMYRSLVTLAVVLPMGLMRSGGTVRSPHMATHLVRGMAGAMSLIGYFYAIGKLPLATAQTLNYTSPIFLAITTVAVLGERFSPWLIVAIVLGFVGVALLLQPTFAEGNEGPALIGLFSGVLAAWAYLSVRTLGRLGEPDWRVVFWFGFVATVLCGAWQAATSRFHAIGWDNVGILAGMGFCGTAAQLAMTRAYRTGNTLVVSALSYSTIVFGTLATFLLWGDRLAPASWLGMVIIIASGILASRVERKEAAKDPGLEI